MIAADAIRGDLEDAESLRGGAALSDGVIRTAFIHDFSKFKANCEIDRHAIEALGAALAGSDRPLIITSGTGLLTPGRLATEDTAPPPASAAVPRVSEQTALAVASRGARVVRLPPSVHGDGDHGFVPLLIRIAREKGASVYAGEGLNRWPAVHRLDAAHLYRLVLEKGSAGARYHAVGEEGVPMREIAEVIGCGMKMPVVSVSAEEAPAHFGWLNMFAGLDMPASSAKTQKALGWKPTGPRLIADLEKMDYSKA